MDMETISKLMGHNNTKSTEDYYCGMRQSEARQKGSRRVIKSALISHHSKTAGMHHSDETVRDALLNLLDVKRMVHPPGFEPGQQAWKA